MRVKMALGIHEAARQNEQAAPTRPRKFYRCIVQIQIAATGSEGSGARGILGLCANLARCSTE